MNHLTGAAKEGIAREQLEVLDEVGLLGVDAVSLLNQQETYYKRSSHSVILGRAQQILDWVDIETLSAPTTELH